MVNSRCNAKDPNNCRYHSQNASDKAYNVYMKALDSYNNATSWDEKQEAQTQMTAAQSVYDATDKGLKEIRLNIRTVENYSERCELTMRFMKAKIARIQELQSGSTTDAVFFTPEDYSWKMDAVNSVVAIARSDHFYDEYEKFYPKLKEAKLSEDSYEFTTTYNNLLNGLQMVAEETNWRNPVDKEKFLSEVNSLRIKGKVYRTHIPLNSTNTSMLFDA